MKFIVIIICLSTLKYIPLGDPSKRFSALFSYLKFIYRFTAFIPYSWIQMLIMLIPLSMLVFFIDLSFHGILDIIAFSFNVVVLYYSLYPISLEDELETGLEEENIKDIDEHKRILMLNIFSHAVSHIFSVIFWYLVLGPLGALGYRMVVQLSLWSRNKWGGGVFENVVNASLRWKNLLDWVPVRLMSLGFTMAGSFLGGFSLWMSHLTDASKWNERLLMSTALGALHLKEPLTYDKSILYEALKLVERSMIIWLLIVAVFTLGVWI